MVKKEKINFYTTKEIKKQTVKARYFKTSLDDETRVDTVQLVKPRRESQSR